MEDRRLTSHHASEAELAGGFFAGGRRRPPAEATAGVEGATRCCVELERSSRSQVGDLKVLPER